jgi:ubiquinone biosynthesis protein COQ4
MKIIKVTPAKTLINRLSLLKAFFFLVKDPTKTDRVFEIADRGREHRGALVDQTVQAIIRQEGFLDLYRANYDPKVPPLMELATYPEGTFGREFARHMIANNLEVEFFPIPEVRGEEQFLIERGRKSHDFWHVLTGFDTSVAGEIGLQAFTLAQIRSPFSAILIAGGLLHAILRAPEIFNQMIDQLFSGYQMGVGFPRFVPGDFLVLCHP